MVKEPSFLVIGDHKTGTSSINEYLKQHPQVYTPQHIKELRFFAYDKDNDYHNRAGSYPVKTMDQYLSFFEDADQEIAIGEASPNYLRSPGTAARIKAHYPDIKIIVSLRNPADRLLSMYQMQLRETGEKPDFAAYAFSRDARRIKGSFYWPDLKSYYDLFPRENILVVLLEDLKQNQVETMQKIYRFVGVDTDYTPTKERYNTGGLPKNRLWYDTLMLFRRWAKALNLNSAGIKRTGKSLIGRSLSHQKIEMSAKLRNQILCVYKGDILRTQELIQRDLSMWLPDD